LPGFPGIYFFKEYDDEKDIVFNKEQEHEKGFSIRDGCRDDGGFGVWTDKRGRMVKEGRRVF
jgi:hypothetical protein